MTNEKANPSPIGKLVVGDVSLFTSGDPLTALVRRHLKIQPWTAALVWFLFVNITITIAVSLEGLWIDQGPTIGLLENYSWWLLQVTSVPATIFFFFWMPEGIKSVFRGLLNNHIIGERHANKKEGGDLSDFINQFDNVYSHWGWFALVLPIQIAFDLVFAVPNSREYVAWSTAREYLFWFTEFTWLVTGVMVIMMAIRAILAIVWFGRLFREFEVDVKVLHPDKAGGLSPLGFFSVRVGYLIGVYGFTVVLLAFSESVSSTGQFTGIELTPGVLAIGIIYLVLAPVAFFAPIGAAHSAMKTAKDELILQISSQYEKDMLAVQTMLDADADDLEKQLKKLRQLEQLHKSASNFPVWPFNSESLVRFFSSVLSPLFLGLLPTIFSLILG